MLENFEKDPEKLRDTPVDVPRTDTEEKSWFEGVRETIENKIENLKETFEETKENISDLVGKVTDSVKEYVSGVYENVKDYFSDTEEEAKEATENAEETREFGLDKCSEAACEIFNEGVINEWSNLSLEDRKGIAYEYAEKVAEAFELEEYNGVIITDLGDGIAGLNQGDGYIYINECLLSGDQTPFEIMDTITHELRHQYQSECVNGLHDIPDDVRNEWIVATGIYNYDYPSSYDPWGYKYNPLEIDSNYAGNTVVNNVSNQIFNNALA